VFLEKLRFLFPRQTLSSSPLSGSAGSPGPQCVSNVHASGFQPGHSSSFAAGLVASTL
ncbi:unnamed protein product, partial [Rangifer tarandus platyrhynchus]